MRAMAPSLLIAIRSASAALGRRLGRLQRYCCRTIPILSTFSTVLSRSLADEPADGLPGPAAPVAAAGTMAGHHPWANEGPIRYEVARRRSAFEGLPMEPLTVGLFAGALLLNAGMPGPSVAALVSRVITNGWRDVVPFLAAMWIGEVIWLTMVMTGLTALAQTFELGFQLLKVARARLSLLARHQDVAAAGGRGAATVSRSAESPLSMFGAGMALTLGNPKIMVFYVALLPSLIDLSRADLRAWIILSAVTLVTLAAVDLTWTCLAHRARRVLPDERTRDPDAPTGWERSRSAVPRPPSRPAVERDRQGLAPSMGTGDSAARRMKIRAARSCSNASHDQRTSPSI